MWRTCKAAGRPWPVLDPDDVIDYMVMEAIAIKVNKEEEKARKEVEIAEWKKETQEELKQKFK